MAFGGVFKRREKPLIVIPHTPLYYRFASIIKYSSLVMLSYSTIIWLATVVSHLKHAPALSLPRTSQPVLTKTTSCENSNSLSWIHTINMQSNLCLSFSIGFAKWASA